MKTLRQVLAIAHTEYRFGLRRGGPVVIPILIGVLVAAGILLTPLANLSLSKDDMDQIIQDPVKLESLAKNGFTEKSYKQFVADGMADMTVFSTGMAWPILLLTSLLLLPAVASVTIPADRKFGVGDLLRSLPINAGTYLAGKILGVCLTALLVTLIPLGLFFGILEWVFIKTYQVNLPWYVIRFFLEFALLDWLPLLVWGLTIGILTGTPFQSRRAAIFPGLGVGILSLFFWLAVFKAPAIDFMQTDLALYYLFQNYHSTFQATITKMFAYQPSGFLVTDVSQVGLGRLLSMYLIIVVILFSLAALARQWLKWKENF